MRQNRFPSRRTLEGALVALAMMIVFAPAAHAAWMSSAPDPANKAAVLKVNLIPSDPNYGDVLIVGNNIQMYSYDIKSTGSNIVKAQFNPLGNQTLTGLAVDTSSDGSGMWSIFKNTTAELTEVGLSMYLNFPSATPSSIVDLAKSSVGLMKVGTPTTDISFQWSDQNGVANTGLVEYVTSGVQTPEPASLSLVGLACVLLLGRRGRHARA